MNLSNSSILASESESSEAPPVTRPRWHRIYFLLAAFDLLTISVSLYLNDRLVRVHTVSVRNNQEWAERLGHYSDLGQLVSSVNAPGNDVFDTRDVPGESKRMHAALAEFDEALNNARRDLMSNTDDGQSALLLKDLDLIGNAVQGMVAEAEEIFSYFRNDEPDLAGARMATMDRKNAKVGTAIAALSHRVRDLQQAHFAKQTAAAASLARLEYVIAAAIVLIVCCVTLYGHKITRQVAISTRERESLINALKHTKEAADAANRSKSQFLANMSHELRTPMNAIIGYSEMLTEEFEDLGHTQYIPDVKKIRAAGKHLLGLINDILDLSKIEAGKMEVFAEDFEAAPFLEDVVVTVQSLIESRGNTLTIESAADLGSVHSDQTKIRQILFNLLSNAAKFTDHGAIILKAARISHEGQDWLELEVRDSGIGMTTEQQSRVFEAFTQAEASTTRRFGGTGLGLTITRRFSEMLGGRLTVKSEPGVGSSFIVRIPGEYRNSETHGHPATSGSRSSIVVGNGLPSKREILVIDDEPDARDLMRRFLLKEGYAVATAGSGPEGLEQVRRRRPAAITLDVMMAGMDGWAVLQQLKEDPTTADIPVVMISMVDNAELGYALGVADYLIKPPDRKRLSEILKRVCVNDSPSQILIVDDDDDSRQVLASLIAKSGCTVREARNGQEALDSIADRHPDLMLLDLMMPVMSGFEVIAELNRQGLTGKIPIVVLTARDITRDDRARLDGQVRQIRNKSAISRDELLREINVCLKRSCAVGCEIVS